MERKLLLAREPLDERTFQDVYGDAAGPQLERALGHAPAGELRRQVGVLDHLGLAIDGDDDAEFLFGREPLDDLERNLRVRLRDASR